MKIPNSCEEGFISENKQSTDEQIKKIIQLGEEAGKKLMSKGSKNLEGNDKEKEIQLIINQNFKEKNISQKCLKKIRELLNEVIMDTICNLHNSNWQEEQRHSNN